MFPAIKDIIYAMDFPINISLQSNKWKMRMHFLDWLYMWRVMFVDGNLHMPGKKEKVKYS